MTGPEALAFVQLEIARHEQQPDDERCNAIKLSYQLARDLCKLKRSEIGEFSLKLMLDGPQALKDNGFLGYAVDIDYNQDGPAVAFGIA